MGYFHSSKHSLYSLRQCEIPPMDYMPFVADGICEFLSMHEALIFTSVCKFLRSQLKYSCVDVDLSQIDWSHPKSLSVLLTLKRVRKLSLTSESDSSLSNKSPKRRKADTIASLIQGYSDNLNELILRNDVRVDRYGKYDVDDKNCLIHSLNEASFPKLRKLFVKEQQKSENYDGVMYERVSEDPRANTIQSLKINWTDRLLSLTWFGFEIKTCQELFSTLNERPAALLNEISVNYIDGDTKLQHIDGDFSADIETVEVNKIFRSAEFLHESISHYIRRNGKHLRKICFEHFLFNSFSKIPLLTGSLTSGFCPYLEDLAISHCQTRICSWWNGKVYPFLPPYSNLKSITLCNNKLLGTVPSDMYYHRTECIREAIISATISTLSESASPKLERFAYTESVSSSLGCTLYNCEIFAPLINKLKSFSMLKELVIRKNGVEFERVSGLFDAFSFWPVLSKLTAVGIELAESDKCALGYSPKHLKLINLMHANLNFQIGSKHSVWLRSLRNITHLSLTGNKFGGKDFSSLLSVLESLSFLTYLDMRWVQLSRVGMFHLMDWLEEKKKDTLVVNILEAFMLNVDVLEDLLTREGSTSTMFQKVDSKHFFVCLKYDSSRKGILISYCVRKKSKV